MIRHFATLGLCAAAALAQSALETPRAGCLRGVDSALRPVHGIGGALLAGAPLAPDVIAAACSDTIALVKTLDSLEVRDADLNLLARWPAPSGSALLALTSDKKTGFAYYLSNGTLVQVDAQSPPRAVLDSQSLGGSLLAIASLDPFHVMAVVADTPGPRLVRIAVAHGTINSQTPLENMGTPLTLLSDGTIVFAEGASLVVRPPGAAVGQMAAAERDMPAGLKQRPVLRPVAYERRIALPSRALAIDQMSSGWLAVRVAGAGAPVAVRIESGRLRTYRIPAVEVAQ